MNLFERIPITRIRCFGLCFLIYFLILFNFAKGVDYSRHIFFLLRRYGSIRLLFSFFEFGSDTFNVLSMPELFYTHRFFNHDLLYILFDFLVSLFGLDQILMLGLLF